MDDHQRLPDRIERDDLVLAAAADDSPNPVVDDSAELDFEAGRWIADPLGRHELRWWNGVDWDQAVRDGEVVSFDPVGRAE